MSDAASWTEAGPARAGAESNLLLWLLIASELVVFGALLGAFMIVNVLDPEGFSALRRHLDIGLAGLATAVLLSSGFLAARAVQAVEAERSPVADLLLAAGGGLAFCALKLLAYGRELAVFGLDESRPFELYLMITGFHLAHVVFGAGLLLAAAFRPEPRTVATVATIWHVIDLVWIVILPVVYMG